MHQPQHDEPCYDSDALGGVLYCILHKLIPACCSLIVRFNERQEAWKEGIRLRATSDERDDLGSGRVDATKQQT